MRAIGRGSISSILKVVVDIAWVLACAGLGFVAIIAGISIYAMANPSASVPGFERVVTSSPAEVTRWVLNWSALFAGAMVICAYLRGVFGTLVNGDPFVPENAGRLRMIAIVVAGLEILRMLINLIIPLLFVAGGAASGDGGTEATLRFDLSAWMGVLTILVLSQVFSEGAALREDQKMTI